MKKTFALSLCLCIAGVAGILLAAPVARAANVGEAGCSALAVQQVVQAVSDVMAQVAAIGQSSTKPSLRTSLVAPAQQVARGVNDLVAACGGSSSASPTLSFTANGSTNITVAPGTAVNYVWTSNGVTATSSYGLDSPDTCGARGSGPYPWAATSPNGSVSGTVADCQAGHTYAITVTASDADGNQASKTVFVTVGGTAAAASLVPSIAGVQGYDPDSKAYTVDVATANTYLILYGSFAAKGNVVSVDDAPLSAAAVTYESQNQINVSLAGVAVGSHTVSVADGAGSATKPFTVKAAASVSTVSASPTTMIGPYFWGGSVSGVTTTAGILQKGDALARQLGVGVIRIAMSAKSDMDYGGGSCIPNFTLTGLARRDDFNAVLSDPQFKTVIVTAYDGISFGDCLTKSYLDPAFYTPTNVQKIEAEYLGFANYLKQFDKTFIIGNWEGDNDAYCGSIGAVAANGSSTCPDAPQHLAGLAAWFAARHAGIKAAGASNVHDDIEFNSVNILKTAGLPSLLWDVIPHESADYYSYSSYESVNVSPEQFATDIDTIRSQLPGGQLIIGEFGFRVGDFGDAAVTADRLQSMVQVMQDKKIPYGIVWALLDNPPGFGLENASGVTTPSGVTVQNIVSTASGPVAP